MSIPLSHPESLNFLQKIVIRKMIRNSQEGDVKKVRHLLESYHIFSQDDKNIALILSSENNHTKVVKLLLEFGADADNRTLYNACKNGNVEVVKILLPRLDPSSNDNVALLAACRGGNLKIVDLLLNDPRVDPSANNNGALVIASEYGHLKVVKRLLAHAHFYLTSDSIKEALRFALKNDHLKIVELLDSVINTPVARAAFRPKNKKSVRKIKKSTRKSTRKTKKSTRKTVSRKSTKTKSKKTVRKSTKTRKSLRKMNGFRMVPGVVINKKFMENMENMLEIHTWPHLTKWEDLIMHDLAGGDMQATDKIIEILKGMGVEKGKNITIENLGGKQCTFVLEQVNVYSSEYKSRDDSIILVYSFDFYNIDDAGGHLQFKLSLDPRDGRLLDKEYQIILSKIC